MTESSATVSIFYADLCVLPLEIHETVRQNADIEQIAASKLIEHNSYDTTYWWQLPDQIEQTADPMTAEGVYDRRPTLKTPARSDPPYTAANASCTNALPGSQFETKLFRKRKQPLMNQRVGRPYFQSNTGFNGWTLLPSTWDPKQSSIGLRLRAHRGFDKQIHEGIVCLAFGIDSEVAK